MLQIATLRKALDLAVTITLLVAGATITWRFALVPLFTPAAPEQVEHVDGLRLSSSRIEHVVGAGSSAIVEFSDFQCPFCSAFARNTLPALRSELVEPGRVRYVALNFPLEEIHPHALEAGEAAECAGRQGRFWAMHERLFSNPAALTRPDLLSHASSVSLDVSLFQSCLDRDLTLAKVRADRAEGTRLDVRGTPTFFLGQVRQDGDIDLMTRIRGVVSPDVFKSELDRIQDRSRRPRAGGTPSGTLDTPAESNRAS